VTGDDKGAARVWDVATWQPVTPPMMHSGGIAMARFSPDGRLIGTASEDRTARVWNAATGEPVTPPLVHQDDVKCVDFSPDQKKILTASTDDTACVWNLATGEPVLSPLQHTRIVDKAIFSPDGSCIMTASADRTARIWDARTGKALSPPLKHDYALIGVAFTPDGETAMAACWNGTLRMWNVGTGLPITESLEPGDWTSRLFALDPANRRMAVGGKDASVRLWHWPEIPKPLPAWFLIFAECVAGVRVGDRGQLEFVSAGDFETVVRELRSKDKNDFYVRMAEWFLANPSQRAQNPF